MTGQPVPGEPSTMTSSTFWSIAAHLGFHAHLGHDLAGSFLSHEQLAFHQGPMGSCHPGNTSSVGHVEIHRLVQADQFADAAPLAAGGLDAVGRIGDYRVEAAVLGAEPALRTPVRVYQSLA